MTRIDPEKVFDSMFLEHLFPPQRADEFFEALYGGAEQGAFDISLDFQGFDRETGRLILEFRLTERPGMCMACSLTYGLPPVFKRHPVINLSGIVEQIGKRLSPHWKIKGYDLGPTTPRSPKVNFIPLIVQLEQS